MPVSVPNVTKTFSEMVAEAEFLLADGRLVFPEEAVKRAVNSGLSMVHNSFHREPLDAYFTTEVGVREYIIPDSRYDAGYANVEAVWVGDSQLDVIQYDVDDGERGEPTGYALRGNNIVFDKQADQEYTVHVLYLREYVPLVSGGDTADMSDVEIQAGIFYACYLLKLKDEEFQSANAFKAAFDDAIGLASRFPSGLYSGEDGRIK